MRQEADLKPMPGRQADAGAEYILDLMSELRTIAHVSGQSDLAHAIADIVDRFKKSD